MAPTWSSRGSISNFYRVSVAQLVLVTTTHYVVSSQSKRSSFKNISFSAVYDGDFLLVRFWRSWEFANNAIIFSSTPHVRATHVSAGCAPVFVSVSKVCVVALIAPVTYCWSFGGGRTVQYILPHG